MVKKFIEWGLCDNVWIWFHLCAGAFGANLSQRFMSAPMGLLTILLLAVGWEVVEFFLDGGVSGMIEIYGSIERWLYDSLGDVVGAVVVASLVLFRI